MGFDADHGFLTDYLPPHSWVALVEPGDLKEQAKLFFERVADPSGLFTADGAFANLLTLPNVTVTALPRASVEASVHLRVESVERFSGNVHRVRDELDAVAADGTSRVMIACQTDAECHRLTDVLKACKLSESHRLKLVTGHVRAGFRLVARAWWCSAATSCSTASRPRPGRRAPPPACRAGGSSHGPSTASWS